MKKFLYLLLLSLFVLASCEQEEEIIGLDSNKKLPKVTICHYDSENDTWKTISINENALEAHLAHGDQFGDCSERRTYVPDDNFERLLICMGYDNIIDDHVLTSNINTVEELIFQEANAWSACPEFGPVTDLTGIEDFKALKFLDIYNNHRIEIIDLTKNTALTQIYFEDAFNRVENLDLTKNIALEVINLAATKIYGALDLSKNTGLWEVNISSVPIHELNLKNENNTNISIGSCHLYRLHPDLTCIQVDDVEWSNENWFKDSGVIFSEDCGY